MENELSSSQEKLYKDLNKQLSFYLKAIRYSLAPVTLIVFAIGIYWGIDINQARKEISSFRDSMEAESRRLEQNKIDYKLSSREMDLEYNEYKNKILEATEEFNSILKDFEELRRNNVVALENYNELYEDLKGSSIEMKGLINEVRDVPKETSYKVDKIIKRYELEIELAKKGADEKIEMQKIIHQATEALYRNFYDIIVKYSLILKYDLQKQHIVSNDGGSTQNAINEQKKLLKQLDEMLKKSKPN